MDLLKLAGMTHLCECSRQGKHRRFCPLIIVLRFVNNGSEIKPLHKLSAYIFENILANQTARLYNYSHRKIYFSTTLCSKHKM